MRIERYGGGGEKLSPAQMQLFELEPVVSEMIEQADSEHPQVHRSTKKSVKHPGRQELPANLPRVERILPCALDQRMCKCCGKETVVIGYEESSQLDVEPAKYFVLVTKRGKRACRSCEELGVVSTPLPPRIIEKCLASDPALSLGASPNLLDTRRVSFAGPHHAGRFENFPSRGRGKSTRSQCSLNSLYFSVRKRQAALSGTTKLIAGPKGRHQAPAGVGMCAQQQMPKLVGDGISQQLAHVLLVFCRTVFYDVVENGCYEPEILAARFNGETEYPSALVQKVGHGVG
jgi:hypothetical protein